MYMKTSCLLIALMAGALLISASHGSYSMQAGRQSDEILVDLKFSADASLGFSWSLIIHTYSQSWG